MIDWAAAEIKAEFFPDLKSQHDQFQCELGNLSDKLGNQFNSQFEKISTTFNEHIKVQLNDEFMKSNVTDVFSALVQQAVTDITSELKVVKDSVESTAMDIAICKDRLDAADKHYDELMNNQVRQITLDNGIVHHSYQGALQSIILSSTPISSSVPTPIILQRGQDVMSQVAGPTGVGESQYRGNTANIVSTGIGSEDQGRENRLSYINDTQGWVQIRIRICICIQIFVFVFVFVFEKYWIGVFVFVFERCIWTYLKNIFQIQLQFWKNFGRIKQHWLSGLVSVATDKLNHDSLLL